MISVVEMRAKESLTANTTISATVAVERRQQAAQHEHMMKRERFLTGIDERLILPNLTA